ncbi:MAG: T9SS type A sorting domain-containing protein [Chitinophagales bacterium]|nr:T9SS type A sorting domain-containing protein [Chitinophagales bacterium]MDW8418257.1 T9SS type A sorting domain-containing protein [Chitinophagales bacterium]
MRKITLTVLSALGMLVAIAQPCTIDQSNTEFFDPKASDVPCAIRGVMYDEVLQIYIPQQVDLQDYGVPISYILTCDSVVLDSITGLPSGLNWSVNPNQKTFLGGTRACGRTFGTTNEPVGVYQITFHGLIYLRGNPFPGFFDGDTFFTISQFLQANQGTPTYPLRVINQGQPCDSTVSVFDIRSSLNISFNVFPNPARGEFYAEMNTGKPFSGELVVTDATGRRVYGQPVEVNGWLRHPIYLGNMAPGLYIVQFRTAEGTASRTITLE